MIAIVLTYDKYVRITDHMIQNYMNIWPENPFIFRIPYQIYPSFLKDKYQNRVELVRTDSRIKPTLLSLIEDLNDDEWIFWCIDDRYPIDMKIDNVSYIYNWILDIPPSVLSGVMFSNFPKMMHVKNIMPEDYCLYDNRGRKYFRRKNYAMIWMHQFLRVSVIRKLFNEFPDDFNKAKQMDYFKAGLSLPEEHKLYLYSKHIAEYGESTHRGQITLNCVNSFKKLGMELPPGLEITNKEILIQKSNCQLAYLKYKIEQLVFRLLFLFSSFTDNYEGNKDSAVN